MKSLLILRGIPGSGKSKFVTDNELEQFTISKDIIRNLIGTVDYDDNLNLKLDVSRIREDIVEEIFIKSLENKLSRGNFVVIDNCNITAKTINQILKYSKVFGYTVFMKSFSVSHNTYERLKTRKSLFKEIPRISIEKYISSYLSFSKDQLIKEVDVIEIETICDIEYYYSSKLSVFCDDYNSIDSRKINHFIGDIHGDSEGLNRININDKDLYVFLGDYCDRGPDSVGVLKKLIDLSKKDNIILLEGNHEVHLRRWVNDMPPVSKSFEETTLPYLEKEGIDFKEKVKLLLDVLKPFVVIKFNENFKAICSHAGLSDSKIVSLPTFYRGVGTLITGSRDIDKQDRKFNKGNPNILSIHGHISYEPRKAIKYNNVINLDSNSSKINNGILECIIKEDLSKEIIEYK